MEDWAEIRRLHRAEGVPIREIARRLGVARNTVRAALASDRPPKYEREPRGSVVDAYEPRIRALLTEWPRMPGPVIAERIKWPYSMPPLRRRLAVIRPEYVGVDPFDHAFELRIAAGSQPDARGQGAGERRRWRRDPSGPADRGFPVPHQGFRHPPQLRDQLPHPGQDVAGLPGRDHHGGHEPGEPQGDDQHR